MSEPEPRVLRLFEPGQTSNTANPPLATWRLSRFFEDWFVPIVLNAKDSRPRNLKSYRESLKHWSRIVGDPPLDRIDSYLCAAFVKGLWKLAGAGGGPISPNTIRKHVGAIQALLDRAGPPSRSCRNAVGLLESVPWIERPGPRKKVADDAFALEEIRL